MADVSVNPTASYTVAADVVGTVGYQRIKLDVGASGVTSGDVGATNPLPVTGTVLASGTVTVLGSVSVSGTAIVSVVPGVSVNALVTGVVSISVMPAVSGTVTVNGSVAVVPGVSVVAQVSGTVTVVPGLSVSVSVLPTVLTIVTQLGTQMVSIAQTSVSIAALPTVNTVVTVLGTQIVTLATGATIATLLGTVLISGTVTAGAGTTVVSVTGSVLVMPLYSTTATPSAAGTGAIVWVANPGAAVATTVITVNTIAAGFSVNALVTGVVSVSVLPAVSISVSAALGTVITILGTQIVSVVPGLSVIAQNSGMLYTIGLPTQASTAQIVVVKPAPMQAVQIVVAATAVAVSANKYIFTIWTGLTGAPAAAGTTSWAVPAGKVLRLNNLQIAVTSSAVLGGSVQAFVGVGATASMVSASISTQLQLLKIQVFGAAALQSAAMMGASADVGAGESIAVFIAASTAAIMRDLVITGQLF